MPDGPDGLRRFMELVNDDRREEALALIESLSHPDVEFRPVLGAAMEGRTYRGPEEAQAYFRDVFDAFKTFRYERADIQPVGEDVFLLLATVEASGRESGAVTRQEVGMVVESDDDLLRRAIAYTSHAEARAAAEALDA